MSELSWHTFSNLSSASLPDRIAETIRDAIVSGRLKAGDQVVESRLAKQIGVGQNAVREALHELGFQGYVVKFPNRGTFVAKLSRQNLDEIFRMRMEMEALAVYWARERDRPANDDLIALNEILDRAAKAAREQDLPAYARADTDFHRFLWKLAGNSYLEKCLELVAAPQLCCALMESERPLHLDLEALVAQHREWLQAICDKTPRTAFIHTRNRISTFWGEVERAMSKAEAAGQR